MADWQDLARRAARREGIPANLYIALVQQESSGNQNAVSPAGAIGYSQLMPGTAKSLGVNPRDPWQNLLGGAKYLRQQFDRFGNVNEALAAYNAGPGAVAKYGGIPPYAETQNYVKTIRANAGHIGAIGQTTPAAGSTTTTGAATGLTAPDTGSGVDVSALLAALQGQKQAPATVGLQAPSFSATPPLPAGYQALTSGGGPQPQPDLGSLLSLVRTQGADPSAGVTGAVSNTEATQSPSGTSGGTQSPTGKVTIAAGANRAGVKINPAVVNFVSEIAGRYGQPLTIGTGTNHNRLTVNGTVSDHWSGNAADIPLTGRALIKAGQDALIQAGMSPAKARQQTGGGYNVGGWQIIFNTDAPGWGNHLTHLHVGRRTR